MHFPDHFWRRIFAACLILALVLTGCQALEARSTRVQPPPQAAIAATTQANDEFATWRDERDYIGLLAAFTVVYLNWQTADDHPRGYNIGCVLMNGNLTSTDERLVYWARNSVNATINKTQHGEIRAMTGYVGTHTDIKDLKNFTVYTTLEPCAQCAGMMTMLGVGRCVWGQDDPEYGDVLERLQLKVCLADQPEICYPAYPRTVDTISPEVDAPFYDNFAKSLEMGCRIPETPS